MKVTAMTPLFGEGEADVEKVLEPIINNEDTRQALSLILGGLSDRARKPPIG